MARRRRYRPGSRNGTQRKVSQRQKAFRVGKLERSNPIPPGIYWVDVFEPSHQAFIEWKTANKTTVIIRSTVHHEADSGGPSRDWVLFEVKADTPRWPLSAKLGFPEIAEKGKETKEEDTVQKPPPEKDPIDTIGEAVSDIAAPAKTGVLVLLGVVVVGGIGYALVTRR